MRADAKQERKKKRGARGTENLNGLSFDFPKWEQQ